MSLEVIMRQRAKEVRQRLMYPKNAVPDTGIDLKRGIRIPSIEVAESPLSTQPRAIVSVVEYRVIHKPPLTFQDIIQVVADHRQTSVEDICGPIRKWHLVLTRRIIVALTRRLLPQRSVASIGRGLKKDHTSILHGEKWMKSVLPSDFNLSRCLDDLEAYIRGRYHC